MKIGQLVRYRDGDDGWKIGKIIEISKGSFVTDNGYYIIYKEFSDWEVRDKLLDLIKIGDIIFGEYLSKVYDVNSNSVKTNKRKFEMIINSENDIKQLKYLFKHNDCKIATIELRENRKKQEIKYD